MKKIIFLFTLAVMVSCKPTETNYRKAYEVAKARTDQTGIIEGTVYESIRSLGTTGGIIDENDTIPMIAIPVKLSEELNVPNALTEYGIAIGQFKQRFNARSLMSRVHEQGYPKATIVQNAEPLYYVVIPGAATPHEAAALYRNTSALQDSIPIKDPYPLVLRIINVSTSRR